jgi:hypothetical protein
MGFPPSQPFAGIGITYPRREEAEAERQHDNVQHGMLLCVVKREPVKAARFDRGQVPSRT